MACGSSTAKSHYLCTMIFLYTLIYDRIQEKYDDLRPYMEKYDDLRPYMEKYDRYDTVYRVRNRRPGV
jgi:hypothetical protein